MSDAPTFGEGYIDLFIRRRVCARCYGDLEKRPRKAQEGRRNMYEAYCPLCEDKWHYATVSAKYANLLGQRALGDIYEVKMNMPDLFPRRQATPQQILSELGF